MLRHSQLAAASAALVVIASAVAGQTPTPAPVQVHGVVYDSLRGIPLAGALVSVAGDSRLAKADSRGRFVLDSVLPGERTFAAQHAALDSVGFSGISARVTVTDGRSSILIAAPSFPTLWRTVCGTSRPPKDSGFVYGTVRDAATQTTTPNATRPGHVDRRASGQGEAHHRESLDGRIRYGCYRQLQHLRRTTRCRVAHSSHDGFGRKRFDQPVQQRASRAAPRSDDRPGDVRLVAGVAARDDRRARDRHGWKADRRTLA